MRRAQGCTPHRAQEPLSQELLARQSLAQQFLARYDAMDFGLCMAKADDVELIVQAESLGYSHAWVADSQMIWSDCYATLALAAARTRTIRLGTGVAVAGTRIPPVTAHSIATINRLAPGRTFLGIGTGNTAMRLMGQKPLTVREFGEYLAVLRPLLHGEEADFSWRGRSAPIRMDMLELGFMAVEPRVPIYVSGFGPKAQALAGQYGDGLVMSIPPQPQFMGRALAAVRAGAERAGRALPADFTVSSLTAAALLEPGETLASERIVRECGPWVTSSLHYLYEKVAAGDEPPPHVRGIWKDYVRQVEQTPPERRHRRIHAGHCTYLLPEEARFVTPGLIRSTCLAGPPQEVLEQVRALEGAGLHQLILLPSLETQHPALERFARQVMARL
jgi:alkanesulfonate monooxygenase SsuD/methylene tetrahydromethanopterin reductase-like flavin-dependent oxidoreductase (luciferase family)